MSRLLFHFRLDTLNQFFYCKLQILCLFTLFYIQAPWSWSKYSGRGSPSVDTRTVSTTGVEPTPEGLCCFSQVFKPLIFLIIKLNFFFLIHLKQPLGFSNQGEKAMANDLLCKSPFAQLNIQALANPNSYGYTKIIPNWCVSTRPIVAISTQNRNV